MKQINQSTNAEKKFVIELDNRCKQYHIVEKRMRIRKWNYISCSQKKTSSINKKPQMYLDKIFLFFLFFLLFFGWMIKMRIVDSFFFFGFSALMIWLVAFSNDLMNE